MILVGIRYDFLWERLPLTWQHRYTEGTRIEAPRGWDVGRDCPPPHPPPQKNSLILDLK